MGTAHGTEQSTLESTCDRPTRATHIIQAKVRPPFFEITDKWRILPSRIITPPLLVPYTSGIGTCIEALPHRIRQPVGDIPTLTGWDPTTPVNIIIATYGSVTLRICYHSWVIATADKDIILCGGGPDDRDLCIMTSYRSELGGVVMGMVVVGTLSRSGIVNIASAKFVCDNESAVLSATRPLIDSILYQLEGDHDLVSTIKDLQTKWCRHIEITYV
jgi:hypothetical protein